MEALRIVGVLLHRIFRLLLFPLRTLLSLFHLSLEFVSCGLSTVLGGGLLIVVLLCRFFGDMSNQLFLQTLVVSVLLAVIPKVTAMALQALVVGMQGILSEI